MYWHRAQTGVLGFGACLMEISKGTFCWLCKMVGKVLNRAKRREGHSITTCALLYLALQSRLLPPYNWTENPDLSNCPKRPVPSHLWAISEKEYSVI